LISTHSHIDHILGNTFASQKYGLGIEIHEDGVEFLRASIGYASVFGINVDEIQRPSAFIKENDIISFGNTKFRVICTPGHAAGSICLVNEEEKYLFSGDVIFHGSIGRTDLPTGDYDLLIRSINDKIMILDDDYKIYCGHGPVTTVGYERVNNPFLK
jgi:glyoxylase-like metal-dependent hydrolase (beta-lactamase superfamily II)